MLILFLPPSLGEKSGLDSDPHLTSLIQQFYDYFMLVKLYDAGIQDNL